MELSRVWGEFRDAPNLLSFVGNSEALGLSGNGRAAHSIYFETMGDLGFLGFFIFLAILVNSMMTAVEVRRITARAGVKLEWVFDLATMLLISILAFAFGGALLSAAYFELPYILIMLLEILKRYARQEISNGMHQPVAFSVNQK